MNTFTFASLTPYVGMILRILLLVGIGVPALRLTSKVMGEIALRHKDAVGYILARRAIFYGGIIFITILVLQEFGFHLSPLLGAAGIAGAAVAFASQTAIGNLLSGLFLIGEQSVMPGDYIEFKGVSAKGVAGKVESLNLLSVWLRTDDQKLVRIPNEALLKEGLKNASHFSVRRFDFNVTVARDEHSREVIETIRETIKKNGHASDEKPPVLFVKQFHESAVEIFVGVYVNKNDYLKLYETLPVEIQEALFAKKIQSPCIRYIDLNK